jgi:hypothetical protein
VRRPRPADHAEDFRVAELGVWRRRIVALKLDAGVVDRDDAVGDQSAAKYGDGDLADGWTCGAR